MKKIETVYAAAASPWSLNGAEDGYSNISHLKKKILPDGNKN